MRIGIITFHFVYNCGAMLQCFALQEKLKSMGYEVEIINYQPWYHKNRYSALKNPIYYGRKQAAKKGSGDTIIKRTGRGIKGFFAVVYSWRHFPEAKIKDRYFSTFKKSYLQEGKLYRKVGQLRKYPPKCEVYISGSDQLWNAKLTENRIDPAYLLDFGTDDTKRITYSMGCNFKNLSGPINVLKARMMRFNAISLRENEYYTKIEELTEGKVPLHIDLDPTFLLRKEEYESCMSKERLVEEPFIFTYTMPDISQKKVYNTAKELGKRLNMKVVDACGNPSRANQAIEDHRLCGPAEFLWYISHAAYVVTNSFHGTAFSVIFQKNFVAIPHSQTGYRVTELLDKLALHDRWVKGSAEALEQIQRPVDYAENLIKIEAFRAESERYLKTNIEN